MKYKDRAYLKLFRAAREIENAIKVSERLNPDHHSADLYSRYLHLQSTIAGRFGVVVAFNKRAPKKKP